MCACVRGPEYVHECVCARVYVCLGLSVCVCGLVYVHGCVCASLCECVWCVLAQGVRGQFPGISCILSPHVGSGDLTQIIRFCRKKLEPLSHLTDPFKALFETRSVTEPGACGLGHAGFLAGLQGPPLSPIGVTDAYCHAKETQRWRSPPSSSGLQSLPPHSAPRLLILFDYVHVVSVERVIK